MTVKRLIVFFVVFNILFRFVMSYFKLDSIFIDILFYYLVINTLIQKYYDDNKKNLTQKEVESIMIIMSSLVILINLFLIIIASFYTIEKLGLIVFLVVQIGHLVIINTIIYTSNRRYDKKAEELFE